MKFCTLLFTAFATAIPALLAQAQPVIGPIVHPETGTRYHRLGRADLATSRAAATAMGARLAVITDEALNSWIRHNVVTPSGNTLPCWIGLSDESREGDFRWVTGDPPYYANWGPGEPNDFGGEEDAGCFNTDGTWNDVSISGIFIPAVVEVTGPIRVPAEFPTIQDAINAAIDGQIIEVAPGNHVGNFDFGYKKLVVRSQAGPAATTIVTTGGTYGVVMAGGQGPETILEGFTIRPFNNFGTQYGIIAIDGQVVRNCWIGRSSNGVAAGGSVIISDCLITETYIGIAGLQTPKPGNITVQNCTITTGVPLYTFFQSLARPLVIKVSNSIIFGYYSDFQIGSGRVELSHCNTPNSLRPGPGNISSPPRFNGAPGPDGYFQLGEDYTLAPDSPCIDAGNELLRAALGTVRTQLDAGNRPRLAHGTTDANPFSPARIDIGAFEALPTAPEPTCPVDFNRDGFLDFFDYDEFVQAYELGC
jgi:hypothetical protein